MVRVYIGLGANLGDPPAQLRAAVQALAQHPDLAWVAASVLYRSAPLGGAAQPEYCNAVAAYDTALTPTAMLDVLLAIETAAGRVRGGARWASRVLDLDLLLYGDQRIDTARLHVPHPEMHRRNFVIVPLAEIAPQVVVGAHGTAAALAQRLGEAGLQRLGPLL